MTELNDKQRRFAEEYVVDLNATQAAIRAGYSERTAHSQGPRLLEHVGVARLIDTLKRERSTRTEITADNVLREWARLGFADVRRIFTPAGSLVTPTDMDDDTAAAVASIEVVTRRQPGGDGEEPEVEYVHKIKLHDKLGALSKLGDHLGIAVKRTEHTGAGGGPIETRDMTDELARLPRDKRDEVRAALQSVLGKEGQS